LETRLLTSLGKIAGLGGIALGVVLLLFRDFLKQKFLPAAGLEAAQAYHILLAFLVLTFGIAAVGIVAWIAGQNANPGTPISIRALVILASLTISVLATATTVGLAGTPNVDESTKRGQQPDVAADSVQYKPFSDTVSLSEQDVTNSHGVNIQSGFIGTGPEGAWADITINVDGNIQGGGHYKKGDSIRLSKSGCKSLNAYLKDVSLSKTSPISDEDLKKMGPSAEAYIRRSVVLLVSGECKPAISDSPGAQTRQETENKAPDQTAASGSIDCVVLKYREFLPTIGPGDLGLKEYQIVLPEASSNGDYACVKKIIEKGANVNQASPMSALMWAAQGGHENVVRLLLENGASVDQKTDKDGTALVYAMAGHSLATVKTLVEHGADVNFPSSFTPLMSAALQGDLPIIEYLLEKGANACAKSSHSERAADVARREKHQDAEARLRSNNCP
jgi:hypothetical protein